jgi:Flp pilus assembly protein TadG
VRARTSGDEGAATTVLVLVMPVVLLLVMVVVQVALAYHARQVLTAAAQDAALAGTAAHADPDDAATTAQRAIADAASGLVHDVRVDLTETDGRLRVEVEGTVANVIPGVSFTVSGVGESPIEQFQFQGSAS